MNLPNALTLLRMIMIPVFAWAYFSIGPKWALLIFLVASFTDYLDGYLARKLNQVTNFGKLFDPLADKLMLLTALFCLARTEYIPWWVLAVMIIKELVMVVGSMFMLGKEHVVVQANMFGKTATVLFIAAVALIFPWHESAVIHQIGTVVLYIALASSIVALCAYATGILKDLRGKKTS